MDGQNKIPDTSPADEKKWNVVSNLCGWGGNTREEANKETIWLRIKGQLQQTKNKYTVGQ